MELFGLLREKFAGVLPFFCTKGKIKKVVFCFVVVVWKRQTTLPSTSVYVYYYYMSIYYMCILLLAM